MLIVTVKRMSESKKKKCRLNEVLLKDGCTMSNVTATSGHSKGYSKFINRLTSFLDDLELVELMLEGHKYMTAKKVNFDLIEDTKYPRLSRIKDSPYSRELFIRHLRNTVFASFIKDLHEEVVIYENYLEKVLKVNGIKTTLKRSKGIVGKLMLINNRIELDVTNLIEEVRPYLRCRDYIVHADGVLSGAFVKIYPYIPREVEEKVLTNRLRIDIQLDRMAFEKVNTLLKEMDKRICLLQLFPKVELG